MRQVRNRDRQTDRQGESANAKLSYSRLRALLFFVFFFLGRQRVPRSSTLWRNGTHCDMGASSPLGVFFVASHTT